jgi:hydroxymethylpyrimidine pyrophosphatase-like HAD family hydrolase
MADLVRDISGHPALFVASGGALAVAGLAADLHLRQTGAMARAITPLELASAPRPRDGVAVLFSASARHPDVQLGVAAAVAAQYRCVGLVTLRREDELSPELAAPPTRVATVVSPVGKDGFLATNSVLAMATAITRSYVPNQPLPDKLAQLEVPIELMTRERVIALTSPGYGCVAIDYEARLAETGLAAVQVTDYRNLAHGRHVGLSRHASQTTVVAFIAPEVASLAAATLGLLPHEVDIVRVETDLTWPAAALDLLAASMHLAGARGRAAGLDPGRPDVADFGRRLYHLSARRFVPPPTPSPVARKLAAVGIPDTSELYPIFQTALQRWLETQATTLLGGVVLDYDGTCCTTPARFEPLSREVRTALLRLLDRGMLLGFASGRGTSLYRELREWVPEVLWDRVELGLYNGGLRLRLDQRLDSQDGPAHDLAEAVVRINGSVVGDLVKIEARHAQLGVEFLPGVSLRGDTLCAVVSELLAHPSPLPLKALASAHSVDVVPVDSSKATMVDALAARTSQTVLAIGDQGQLGGNDFELLAATTSSLSVDLCSGDPTRCWNLADPGRPGPAALLDYLSALEPGRSGHRFRWSK